MVEGLSQRICMIQLYASKRLDVTWVYSQKALFHVFFLKYFENRQGPTNGFKTSFLFNASKLFR